VKGESKPNAGTRAQGGGNGNNNNNKKTRRRLAATKNKKKAAAAGGGVGGQETTNALCNSDDGSTKCPVHNCTHHSVMECREIKKLTEQFREKMQQPRQYGASSR
jgi:hypothetical protein